MFEEVCLVCGRHLADDGRAYCSDECESIDINSPSLSSASSALSSPHLGYAYGGDVPALLPSALGTALQNVRSRNRHSVSSSSASSASLSILTDEEEEADSGPTIGSEHNYPDYADFVAHESNSKLGLQSSSRRTPLSYARRPSGTNNHSTIPNIHKGTASGSSPGHVRGIPRSAPNYSLSSTEDEAYSDFGCSSRDELDVDNGDLTSESGAAQPTFKSRRPRNRSSLPACFSLLQATNTTESRASPVSSSSSKTVARASPPTPKLAVSGLSAGRGQPPTAHQSIHATPRGRRRVARDISNNHGEGQLSPSSSRSPSRNSSDMVSRADFRGRPRNDMRDARDQVVDWSSMPGLIRGRSSARRNSSPPPKMALSGNVIDNSKRVATRGSAQRYRGRAKMEELDGTGFATDAPGYGNGRSGLVDRERLYARNPTRAR
ncbi:hypothetical protein BDN72DRAFT_225250 [Pluteus cervinus]|uniref:Uncharacterized protein n=1 Tax=Pluteus cervinus TaxID=181527 RepID=A0ACD3BF35_9AGAR|nr:hypothetical protein BDN72DRAFT_225250 [Pluteus cervinus]